MNKEQQTLSYLTNKLLQNSAGDVKPGEARLLSPSIVKKIPVSELGKQVINATKED